MAKLLIRDLDPELIERLKSRARQQGRSLHEEVKSILEAAAPFSMNAARRIAEQWQQRLAGWVSGDSADLIREDRDR